jgi:hypothetical protein
LNEKWNKVESKSPILINEGSLNLNTQNDPLSNMGEGWGLGLAHLQVIGGYPILILLKNFFCHPIFI